MASFAAQFLCVIRNTLHNRQMITPGDRILVGLSGGADSVALTHALTQMAKEEEITIAAAHLHHGLRKEADQDLTFAKNLSEKMEISFHSKRVDLPLLYPDLCVEEAGRIARYQFFRELACTHGYTKIATAHHANDHAEQVLLNLIRGTGTDGLTGIPDLRNDTIIRPMIAVRKSEILLFLKEIGASWVEDATNCDPRFLRNRIRNTLIPLLETEYNPKIQENLIRLAAIAKDERDWQEAATATALTETVLKSSPNLLVLDRKKTLALLPGLRRRVLRMALCQVKTDLKRIGFQHIADMETLLARSQTRECHLPGNIRVTVSAGQMEIRKEAASLRTPRPVFWFEKEIPLSPPFPRKIPLAPELGSVTLFCAEPVQEAEACCQKSSLRLSPSAFPLTVRFPKPGDRMRPAGRNGSRKVTKLLSEKGIPAAQRQTTLLFFSKGEVIWIPGLYLAKALHDRPFTNGDIRLHYALFPMA